MRLIFCIRFRLQGVVGLSVKFGTGAEVQTQAECGAALEATDHFGSMYTIHLRANPPCRQLRSQFVSKLMLKSG